MLDGLACTRERALRGWDWRLTVIAKESKSLNFVAETETMLVARIGLVNRMRRGAVSVGRQQDLLVAGVGRDQGMWNGEFGGSISCLSTHRRSGRSQAIQLCVIFAGWPSSPSARLKFRSSRVPSAASGLFGFELEVAVHKVFQGHPKTVRLGDGIGDGTCGA